MTDAAQYPPDLNFTRVPEIGAAPAGSAAEIRLAELWESAPGWRGWLSTVDHKAIGIRYLVTAFIFLLMGGVEALIMRVQLAQPDQTLLTPEQYNQMFTMHGVTMIFLYSLPILSGFSNYLWPLMLGSRDMAFPRLNALSYWVFLFAGIFFICQLSSGPSAELGLVQLCAADRAGVQHRSQYRRLCARYGAAGNFHNGRLDQFYYHVI